MLLETDLIPVQVSSLPPGPWLVFAPHSDDETFGMGGTLILARERRISVRLVVLTDGALGGAEDPAVVAAVREAEARTVADQLGIAALEFWREPDRGLAGAPALVPKIVAGLQQATPATLFFPSPMEYHPDHRAAAWAVWHAAGQAGFEGNLWSYEISTEGMVNQLVDITRVVEEKRLLMAAYCSQVALNDYPNKILGLNRARTYSLPPEVRYAEGFFDFSSQRGCGFGNVIYELLAPYWQQGLDNQGSG